MIAAGSWVACPHCRVFVDAVAVDLVTDPTLRCPWCACSAPASEWAEAGAREPCAHCGHPKALHVGYGTSDAKPPRHGDVTQVVRAVEAPCRACGCRASSGASEVVV